MAFTLSISLALGKSKVGLTLAAQLVSTTGADIGSEVLAGFAEIGNGYYIWTYSSFPDAFIGGIKFYPSGTLSSILAVTTINPGELSIPGVINIGTLDITLALGTSKTGLTLAAQLTDSSGVNTDSEIIAGFVEVGKGYYTWTYSSFADSFRGGIKFYSLGSPTDVLAFTTINPEELVGSSIVVVGDLEINIGHSEERFNINQGGTIYSGDVIEVDTGVIDNDPIINP